MSDRRSLPGLANADVPPVNSADSSLHQRHLTVSPHRTESDNQHQERACRLLRHLLLVQALSGIPERDRR